MITSSSSLLLATIAFARLVVGMPAHAAHATIVERQNDLLDEYDYIVVGGGTAGLTVADRVSESGECEPRRSILTRGDIMKSYYTRGAHEV